MPPDRIRDIADRDGCRTPMPWTRDGGWRDPWLPLGDTRRNVDDQREDPESILRFVRDVIASRRAIPDLQAGAYEPVDAPDGVWAYRRGATTVALNLSDERLHVEGHALGPWTGSIL